MSSTSKPLNRRALLARLGLAAGAAYVAPSLTSIGMARASGASGGSGPSGGSWGGSRNSGPSGWSGPSRSSRHSRNSRSSRGGRGRTDAQAPAWLRRMFP